MVTVGNVNENKRVEAVLETLAANPHLATRVYYTVCGEASLEVREKLSALAAVGNLKGSVLLNGWTPELELRSWLQAADICINLRNPAMEGGSATLAESMLLGKPAIVSDTGVYAELPDECVLKIRTTDEREDLASAISSLVSSFDLRCQMGALAKVYAEERFTAGAYCGSLLSFLNELQHIKPVFEPVHRAGGILREMEIAPSDPIVATIAEMSHKMFCAASSEAPWREP
jgi:glycosyltransferase involved in cell wall biosynthesis